MTPARRAVLDAAVALADERLDPDAVVDAASVARIVGRDRSTAREHLVGLAASGHLRRVEGGWQVVALADDPERRARCQQAIERAFEAMVERTTLAGGVEGCVRHHTTARLGRVR